jgi:hypothetical protein
VTEVFIAGPIIVAWLAIVTINALKGKYVFAVIAFFGLAFLGSPTLVGLIGAIRLGKPRSWWAQRYYDGEKLAESKRRFYQPVVVKAAEPVV